MKRSLGERETQHNFLLSEYGKQKLFAYADSFKEIARTLNENEDFPQLQNTRQNALYKQRMLENRRILAENLNEMASVMVRVSKEVFSYTPLQHRLEKQIVQALKSEKIYIHDIYYIDNKEEFLQLGILMHTDVKGGVSTEEVADLLSVLLNVRLAPALSSPRIVDEYIRGYVFTEEAKYIVLTGAAVAVKESENKSGDNHMVLESENGKIYMMISDGMGSGEKACRDSEDVLDLMEKLIEAGYGAEVAANLVNATLLAMGEAGNMSTLDICEIDRYNGLCAFTKIGAASSFIKRDRMVEQITASTLPLGIQKKMDCAISKRFLKDGDYIFLLSDGIIDAMEEYGEGEDLGEVISNMGQKNPKELAEVLLRYVLKKSKGRIRDDMTILTMGIWENR